MRLIGAFAALCTLAFSSAAWAQDAKSLRSTYAAPIGFYIGAGGRFNWSDFDQALQGVSGVTSVLLGPDLVAQGQAGGTSTATKRASPPTSSSATSLRSPAAPGRQG
jgi:hypothetical protein